MAASILCDIILLQQAYGMAAWRGKQRHGIGVVAAGNGGMT